MVNFNFGIRFDKLNSLGRGVRLVLPSESRFRFHSSSLPFCAACLRTASWWVDGSARLSLGREVTVDGEAI